jgi:hypothetical protein
METVGFAEPELLELFGADDVNLRSAIHASGGYARQVAKTLSSAL